MSDKVKAAGKMVFGAVRVVSGIATGTGHGLLGSALQSQHMMAHAAKIGSLGCKAGAEMFKEGLNEWKES